MPKYFFHIHDGKDLIDTDGTELRNRDAVRSEAIRLAADSIGSLKWDFWGHGEWRLDVIDQQGANVLTLRFSGEDH